MTHEVLAANGVFDDERVSEDVSPREGWIVTDNPANGTPLASVRLADEEAYDAQVERCRGVQAEWRMLPAPKRGEIVRRIGNAFREKQNDLGALVSLEMGKIRAEGVGEVIECIDIADFAVGLSRQLYGLTMPSERPGHRMYEQWHPLGTIGIITAFNFPAAVWAWNAMLAAVCGNAMIWKPSRNTPLTAVAMTRIVHDVMRHQDVFTPEEGDPCDIFSLLVGSSSTVGSAMVSDRRLPLISATGSCRMGRTIGVQVAERLGRSLLELGGNNAIIVLPDCDLELAVRGILFGAVGTAGQRCTTTRRIIVHADIADVLCDRLVSAYATVQIGDPLAEDILMGPLVTSAAVEDMRHALEAVVDQGCEVLCGGIPGIDRFADTPGHFVEPTIVRVPAGGDPAIARDETFAPILYIYEVGSLDEAIDIQNSVDQGLSSAIFTDSFRSAETFLSHRGSDCGIANVNIGTSGAEIGGAFGGEKDTGGGRESGTDSWRYYMRRQTCTMNWSGDLPLAQGISFGGD